MKSLGNALLLIMTAASLSRAVTIQWLGSVLGGPSKATIKGMSRDGSTVTGYCQSGQFPRSFYWNPSAPSYPLMDAIPTDPSNPQMTNNLSAGMGVSDDGSVIMAENLFANGNYYWTQAYLFEPTANAYTLLPFYCSGSNIASVGAAVAGNGAIAAGNLPQATLFDNGASQALPPPPVSPQGDATYFEPKGFSSSGNKLAGTTHWSGPNITNETAAYMYDKATQSYLFLGTLKNNPNTPFPRSEALNSSADGLAAVGVSATTHHGKQPFVWTAQTGMMQLPGTAGGGYLYRGYALSISDDKQVIAGIVEKGPGVTVWRKAIVWYCDTTTQSSGGKGTWVRKLLSKLLAEQAEANYLLTGNQQQHQLSLDLATRWLITADRVSGDGKTFAGTGKPPLGPAGEAFVATLDRSPAILGGPYPCY